MRSLRLLVALAVVATVAAVAAPTTQRPAAAVPVATDNTTYAAMGRVFPDPHGCVRGAPRTSPWAKGNVCATQFIQWNEALDGLRFLQNKFPRFARLVNLRRQRDAVNEYAGLDMQSAGLPQTDLSRDRRDLHVFEITDAQSPIPKPDRKRFVYSLSIHGIERAGLEGGLRAAEDLITWAATKPGQRILEPTDSGPTAADVLRQSVVVFILSNPDGWQRGEVTTGGVFFQRYNGNGMDLNRDFPGLGYVTAAYTPASEPETKAFMAYIREERKATSSGRLTGTIDLHGMLAAKSLSFTMVSPGERNYRKNALTVKTALTTYRDAIRRLAWSPYIAPPDDCPGDVPTPNVGTGSGFPMCADQWGTVWDTINYQAVGSIGDYMDSPLGGDAVGLSNEMALSHITPNTVFEPNIEQLHIDGNKGLIFSQIANLLVEEPATFTPAGRIAFVNAPSRVRHPGAPRALAAAVALPVQRPINASEVNGDGYEFAINGPDKGVRNGAVTVEATFTNAMGISVNNFDAFVLEWYGSPHAGDPVGWHEVARAFRQDTTYMHAGARIDLNDPLPGRYRIRPGERVGLSNLRITFGTGPSVLVPPQQPYDVANTDFFDHLAPFTAAERRPTPVTAAAVLKSAAALDGVDSLVLADDPAPGVPESQRGEWFARLRAFVEAGGNLVLTDGALTALQSMGVVPAGSVSRGVFYAGWMNFEDDRGTTYTRHPLARDIDLEGTAEGVATLGGRTYSQRRQVYEPVALGYYVSTAGSGNSSCNASGDRCDSPNWVVKDKPWIDAGGTIAARTFARTQEAAGSPGVDGVSLGEIAVGAGRIRIAGALLPAPTEKNFHPFGLESYAVTHTGYQVFENLVSWNRGAVAPFSVQTATLPATGGEAPAAAAALMIAAVTAAWVRRRGLQEPACAEP